MLKSMIIFVMLFANVEVDDYFCAITGSSRQCRFLFVNAFHIFRKMCEQTKHGKMNTVKRISENAKQWNLFAALIFHGATKQH